MHIKRILCRLLCVDRAAVRGLRMEGGALIVECAPRKGQETRCPRCGKKRPVHDGPSAPRRWRALDLGPVMTYVECPTLRVACPEHGVVTASVPWAEPGSRFTRAFEEQVAWLAASCSRSATAELMRIDWKSVGPVCKRVLGRLEAAAPSRFDGLVRIGVDETSYKKGRKYMTVVLDHDRCRVVWCAKGHGKEVLRGFFESLTEAQRASVRVVTADGARWIAELAEEWCPGAERVMDPFHVVSWANDVLDGVRREAWRDARRAEAGGARRGRGRPRKGEEPAPSRAKAVKGARYPLLKNPEDLTEGQRSALERVAREDKRLYRAYLLKERLRDVFKADSAEQARGRLDSWLASACRTRVDAVRELSRKVRRHREAIVRAVGLGISNARVEAINNKIKLTVRMGYGFRNIDNLIALVMLRCSNLPLALPGRS